MRTREWLVAGYRRVLRLGPRPFQRRYSAEMTLALSALLTDTHRRSGTTAMFRIWGSSVIDAVRTAWREHREESSGTLTPWRGASTDLRYAIRSWRQKPGFALTAIGTLVVGIGLAVGVFAFADGYLFRTLPFPKSEQLFALRETTGPVHWLRAADVEELRRSPVAEFGFVDWSVSDRLSASAMIIGDRRVRVLPYGVTPSFGQTLQVPLALGRWFSTEDHQPGPLIPVWLSYRFWTRELRQDPDVIGKRFKTVGSTVGEIVVVGVLASRVSSFDLNNEPPEIIVPELPEAAHSTSPNLYSSAIVRLPEGLTQVQAEARLTAAYRALPPPRGPWIRDAIRLRSLQEGQVAGGRPTARLLFAGALLILVLVLVNLVFLLLAKGAARAGEIAMRAALGASRWRLARLFLVESGALALIGLAGGLLAGWLLASVIESRIPQMPTAGRNLAMVPMTFDYRVVVFGLLLGALVVLVGTVWPTWWATRRSLLQGVRTSGGIAHSLRGRTAKMLLVSEVAVATVITIGTVFTGIGIWRYLHPAMGFDYRDRFSVTVAPRLGLVGARADAYMDLRDLRQAMREVPGIKTAGGWWGWGYYGMRFEKDGQRVDGLSAFGVSEGTFDAWQVRLVRGRLFTPEELRASAPIVVVVDERAAARLWPDAEAVGQHLRIAQGDDLTVIGVIRNIKRRLSSESGNEVYLPIARNSAVEALVVWAPGLDSERLRERLLAIVSAMAPNAFLTVTPVTLTELFRRDSGEALFQAPFVAAFGVLAIGLVGIGLFGLVSYLVEHRLREFGIRLALGAQTSHLRRDVFQQSLVPAICGLLIGLGMAWGIERIVKSQMFEWPASVPLSIVIVAIGIAVIAAMAAMAPARRAARVDPVIVLRAD
jgi:predicted permease